MELVLPMYNMHPYFSFRNLGNKVCITHGKIWYRDSGRYAPGTTVAAAFPAYIIVQRTVFSSFQCNLCILTLNLIKYFSETMF